MEELGEVGRQAEIAGRGRARMRDNPEMKRTGIATSSYIRMEGHGRGEDTDRVNRGLGRKSRPSLETGTSSINRPSGRSLAPTT